MNFLSPHFLFNKKPTRPASNETQLLFPGERAWELWTISARGDASLSRELDRGALNFDPGCRDRLLALPAASTFAIPMWAFGANDAELHSAAELRLEKDGLTPSGEAKAFDFERIGHADGRTLIRIDALADSELKISGPDAIPSAICCAPALLDLPDGMIVIWRELGRLVAGLAQFGRVFFYSVLTSGQIDERAIDEVLRWHKQFVFQNMIGQISGILLWTDGPEEAAISRDPLLPVYRAPRPNPVYRPDARNRIIPRAIGEAREQKLRAGRMRGLTVAAGATLTIIVAVLFAVVIAGNRRQAHLLDQLTELSPAATELAGIRERWEEVAPSVDADASPLETLQIIHALSSAERMRITRFELAPNRLSLSGNASSPAEALKFLSSISNSEQLERYHWAYQQPLIAGNGSATFEIEGTIDTEEDAF